MKRAHLPTRQGICSYTHGGHQEALTLIKGVKNVDLNVDKRTATVAYEDTQVTQAEIQKTIEKAGFKTEQSK